MGLVNRVVKEQDLESTVGDMITRIARNAPLSIKAVKESLIETAKPESEWDLSAHESTIKQCQTSTDYTEGRTAFMEKRKPIFIGK